MYWTGTRVLSEGAVFWPGLRVDLPEFSLHIFSPQRHRGGNRVADLGLRVSGNYPPKLKADLNGRLSHLYGVFLLCR